MTRVVFSILGGLVLPVVILIVLGTLTDLLPPSVLTDIHISGRPAPGLLVLPVLFPIYPETYLNANRIAPEIFDTFWFRAGSLILFNWLLYGIISYWLLGKLKWFKPKPEAESLPPGPPVFGN